MNKIIKRLLVLIGVSTLFSLQSGPNFGSLTANFNGISWSCSQVGANVVELNGRKNLQFHVQNEKVEYVRILIVPFNGKGTYEFGNKNSPANLSVSFQNKIYSDNTNYGGGGKGSITITDYIPKPAPGKPGKIFGEFSGTLKDAKGNTLTISKSKFNSTMVL